MSEQRRTDAEREAARQAREAGRSGRGRPPGPTPAPPPPALRIGDAAPRSAVAPSRTPAPPRTRPFRDRPRRPPRSGGPRPRRWRWIGLGGGLVVLLVALWFVLSLFQPFGGRGHGRVAVTVPRDASTAQVGDLLVRDGVLASGLFFKLRAELDGLHVKAGDYDLAHDMSYGAAIAVLAAGPQAPPTVPVTVIPGKSRAQLNALLKRQGVAGSYLRDTVHSSELDPARYGAPAHVPSLEGFLYPDTYDLRRPISIPALVADQLAQFKVEMAKVNLAYAASRHLSAYDVVKIASLEDAEAALPGDLAKVASVIYNRLRLGMRLGLDTTAAYAAGNYSGDLTQAQLDSNSPWNTLVHTGLPPTPIDSPDLAALQAAAHPAHTDYLYFIVRVCGNGALNFTSSYDQFLVWSREYNDRLAAVGAQKTEFCGHGG